MARSKNGEAIPPERRTPQDISDLNAFLAAARRRADTDAVKRYRAVLGYIDGTAVAKIAKSLHVARSTVNKWLGWYRGGGVEGLLTKPRPGAPKKLSAEMRASLTALIELGPIAAGYESGVWSGPMIGDLIYKRFCIRLHNHSVPRLLSKMGFSVQKPRKRLARADAEAQQMWITERLPAIKKKPQSVEAFCFSKTK
ncbi:MAG: IS630 family transposase [Acidobacteriota bacterium]